MKRSKPIFYKFEESGNEVHITLQTNELIPNNIERILGVVDKKVFINGRRNNSVFEKVEIKSYYFPSENGIYLMKRKDLMQFNIMGSFVSSYWNGIRTEESHPYWEDLMDETIIKDMNCTVLTYKHWFSTSHPDHISTCFILVKNEDAENVATELLSRDKEVEKDFHRVTAWRKKERESKKVNWINAKGE